MIPKTKWGNCSQCTNKDTSVVKVGKLLYCTSCHKINKVKAQIKKASDKNKIRSLINMEQNKTMAINYQNKKELDTWFTHRSKEMTGVCINCGGQTSKGDFKYERYSQAHILQKSLFQSVATHPLNHVELCYFGNSCHTNFDNNGYDYAKNKMPNLWEFIMPRIKVMLPHIYEKSKLPEAIISSL